MADKAFLRQNSKIQIFERIEAAVDATNTADIPHSALDSHSIKGNNIDFQLNSSTSFSMVQGLETTSGFVDINWSDLDTNHDKDFIYDGLTANDYATADFFYAQIDSALGAGGPIAGFKFANQSNFIPQLTGVGDWMCIPMVAYNMSTITYDIEVSSGTSASRCKITCILADRS